MSLFSKIRVSIVDVMAIGQGGFNSGFEKKDGTCESTVGILHESDKR